ncbi:MAG: transketolase family protein [Vicinamibacterales bacterium]
MRDAFARTVYEIAKQDPRVFVVVADISPASAMAPFVKEYPDRFLNAGLAEQAMIGLCAGLAMRGCTAFAYTIATFAIYRPFEQLRDDVCYQNLPVTIVGIGGGTSYSLLGGTHHAQEDVAVMSALPNMSVVAPCDPLETAAATWACARHRGPVYLRLGKAGEPVLTDKAPAPFELGKVRMIKDGRDVCIVSYGPIMKMAFDVAARIEAGGRSVAVASAHTLKPLDRDGLGRILDQFEMVIVIEDHSERGGLAAQAKQLAWERRATCALHTFSLRDAFIHVYGSQQDLWRAHGLGADRICASLRSGATDN